MSDDYVDLGITTTDVREHYSRVRRVYDALASIDASEGFAEATGEDGYPTLGSNDAGGWYVKRDNDDLDSLEQGFDRIGHAATFAHDFDTLAGRVDRCLYGLTSYKDPTGLREVPCYYDRENSETVWDGRKPTPVEKDLRGVMAWGDIDLVDELKPKRGDLDDETQAVVEDTIEAYIDEFETLYGVRDAVFALDSVGGLYIMGAPAATLPIGEAFHGDDDAIERVMQAFIDRSNSWLSAAQERVEERVDGAADVIDPDWVNNHNRKYKAPLSVHSKHDAVVTPIDTDDPSYDLTTFDAVDEDLIDAAAEWSAEFTSTDYTPLIKWLVENLWPDYYADNEDWKAALEAWVEDERRAEQRAQAAYERARENRPDPSDLAITTSVHDIYDAVDRLDAEAVAERTIVHQWTDQASGKTDNSSSGKRAFIPIWGRNSNGSATYINTEKGTFVDTGDEGKYGTAVEMALIAEENWTKGDIAKGSDWAAGVDILRDLGFEIPVWIPEAGSTQQDGDGEYETMPFWAVREAAVALGVLPEDGFIRKQGDDGRSYKAFPGATTYNRTLVALEDEGFDHGREYMTDDGERPSETELWGDEEPGEHDTSDAPETADVAASGDAEGADTDAEGPAESDTSSDSDLHETTSATPPATPGSKPPGEKVVAGTAIDYSNSGYGYWETTEDGKSYYEEVTNFELEARSFLRAERGNEILVQLTVWPRGPEPAYELTCPMDVFNDVRRFRDTVVLGRTTTFDGSQSDLNELRKVVGLQDAPERDGTHHMGLHRDEFVTPNGVLRHDGWTDDPTHVYQERNIDVERAWALSPDKHTDYDPEKVVEMLELVHKTRHHERLLPVLGWFYSAPLRPFIQDEEGQFNHMHIRGGTGAGKSSTVETLTKMFGMDGSGKKVDSTTFTLMAAMASSNAVPIWFDEYKPGDIAEYRLDAFQNLLRLNTKWEYDTRGNADKSTEEYHLRAPIVITGEQAIQGSAEERRSIQVAFRDDVKGAGNPMNRAFAELAGLDWDESEDPSATTHHFEGHDLGQHALAFYRFILSMPFDDLRTTWRESREHVRRVIAKAGMNELDDLPRQGLQTIHFGMTVFRGFAKVMLDELDDGRELSDLDMPTKSDVNEAILYAAEEMGGAGGRESHLDQFVGLAQRAARAGYLEQETHYKIVHEDKASAELRLNLNQSFDEVSKYVKDHDLSSEDFLNRAKDYRDRMKEQVEQGDGYMMTHSQYTAGIGNACGIHVATAEEQLEDFSKAAWTGDEEDAATDAEADGEDSEPAAVLASPSKGIGNATVRVAEILEPPEWMQGKGHIVDDAGNIVPYECEGTDPLGDAGVEQGDTVRLRNIKFRETAEGVTAVLSAITDVEVKTRSPDQTGLDSQETVADGGEEQVEDSDETDDADTDTDSNGGDSDDSDDDGGDGEAGGAEALTPRQVCRRAADALPDGEVDVADAANAVAKDLDGKNIAQALQLLDEAASKYGFVEKLDGGAYRRID